MFNTSFRTSHRKGGFSLVVVALAVTVVGILLVSTLPTEVDKSKANVQESANAQDNVVDALKQFREMNDRLPYPADMTIPVTNTDFGTELATCDGTKTRCDANGTHVGTIPTRALRIADSLAFDQWGNRYTYAVNQNNKTISVKDSLGITAAGVEALIISHGPNGAGSYNRAGVSNSLCPETANGVTMDANLSERANCYYRNATSNFNFVKDAKNDNNNKKLDDIVTLIHKCPGNVKGCTMWLDANDPASINLWGNVENNLAINIWKDKSGNGYNAEQSNQNSKPTLKLIDGKYYARFDGVDDWVKWPEIKKARTLFVLTKRNGSIENYAPIFGRSGAEYDSNYGIYPVGNSWMDDTFTPATVRSGKWYKNGTPFAQSGNGIAPNAANSFETSLQLVTIIPTGDVITNQTKDRNVKTDNRERVPNVDIAEIVIYERALTSREQKKVECDIASRWDLTIKGCKDLTTPSTPKNRCPAGVPGCQLWLDGNDVNNGAAAPANGALLANWLDKSGYGNHATQSDANKRPNFKTNVYGTKSAVTFKGAPTNDAMLTGMVLGSAPFSAIEYSAFVVANSRSATYSRALSGMNTNWLLGPYDKRPAHYAGNGWVSYGSISEAVTNLNIYNAVNAVNKSHMYFNGANSTTDSNPTTSPGQLALGALGVYAEALDGEIAEVIIYPFALPLTDRKRVECYLADKWGKCGNLPGSNSGRDYCTGLKTNYCSAPY